MLFMVTFLSTRERIEPLPSQQDSLKQDFRVLLRNRPWLILATVGIISFVMFALQNLSLAFYFKYYIGNEESVQRFNVVGAIALIVALPLASPWPSASARIAASILPSPSRRSLAAVSEPRWSA